MDYRSVHRRSIDDRAGFWAEEAARIEWQTPFTEVLDYSRPPFARWFVGGTTNLCHNAIDRWLPTQADARALVFVSTETNEERVYTFAELHRGACNTVVVADLEEHGDRGSVIDDELTEEHLTRSVDATLNVWWVRVEPTWPDSVVVWRWERHLGGVETSSAERWICVGRVARRKARSAADHDVGIPSARNEHELWVPCAGCLRCDATVQRIEAHRARGK